MIDKPLADPEIDINDEDEMQEIHDFDFERALMLLNLVEKQTLVMPKATSITGIAGAELELMNEQAKAIARRRAEKFRQAQATKDEERRALHEKLNADREAEEQRDHPNTTQKPRMIPARDIPISPEPDEPGLTPQRRV